MRVPTRLALAAIVVVSTIPVLVVSASGQRIDPRAGSPPLAAKQPKTVTLHGDTRVDDYDWLRDKSNPEVIAYLNAENTYTSAVMKPLEPLQEALYQEIVGRIKQTDLDVPVREGNFVYYTRTEEGKPYPIHCRKPDRPDAPEQVILDLNQLAAASDAKYLSVGVRVVSDDGHLLAYTVDTSGYREYTLFVKDLRAGTLLSDRIPKVGPVVWAADNRTLFYGTEDRAKRPYRIYRHPLGADPIGDTLVYEEPDELFRVGVSRSRDKSYLFITSRSATTTEQRTLPADQPEAEPRLIVPRRDGHEYVADHRDGLFYIRTNQDAREFRLVTAPADDPRPANWKELIPERPNVTLRNLLLFRDHAVLQGVDAGLPFLEILRFGDGTTHRVAFPEPAYSVLPAGNPEFDATTLRYTYQSFVTPSSVYDYDMNTREARLLKRTEVLGGFDPADYVSERIFATATDGTRVPIALVSRKSTPRDGSAPLLLHGYGAYGAPTPVTFSTPVLSLLNRGMIYAIAQVRGGGDLGQRWHDEGKMMKKRNTFTDFIACAEHLIAGKYSRRDRLVIRGGSAGGLLIGAVCNLRPDLCRAAVLEVPFVDVLNTMSDPSLPLTIQEYLEWGNPKIAEEYEYLRTYSPYDNIAAVSYPAMLVRTALNDSQVPYWEPAKYVAKMRATRTDTNPLLLKVNMDAGHGGASGRYDALRETAILYAFLLDQVGITE